MSATRKIVVAAATLFLALSAMFTVTGTATAADNARNSTVSMDCDNDWHTPCP